MLTDIQLTIIFSLVSCVLRLGSDVLVPLFLDSLTPTESVLSNISFGSNSSGYPQSDILPSGPSWERIDPFICIWLSMGFDTVLLGIVVTVMIFFFPGTITERERNYSKMSMLFAGGFQAFGALLFQFSSSGSRTPPFLSGALGYFTIPIAFITRFLLLRKRSTRRKLLCAAVIVLAEVVSLLPIMFPGLESSAARREEGGATGVARILWPLCFVCSGIPSSIWRVLLEKSVKDEVSSGGGSQRRLNMAYVMFWNFLGTFSTTLALFWVDLIPGFGLMPNISVFWKQLHFNLSCLFGQAPQCGFHQMFTGWGRMLFKTCSFVVSGLLLRYGEGANYNVILSATVMPLKFLFFTLFDEQPFRWNPHESLSTWLNLVALVIMYPAVVVYNTSSQVTPIDKDDPKRSDDDDNSGVSNESDNMNINAANTQDYMNIHEAENSSLLRRHADSGSQYGSINSQRAIVS